MTTDSKDKLEDFDLFDPDSGEHLSTLIDGPLPARLMLYHDGRFYFFALDYSLPESEVRVEIVKET